MSTPKHAARFTESALAAELEKLRAAPPRPNGFTSREVVEVLGMGEGQVRRLIQRAVEAGVIEVTPSMVKSVITGQQYRTYFYRLTKKARRNGRDRPALPKKS